MANTSLLYERINAMEIRQINYQTETDERFERVFEYISDHEESSQKVFFDGQIYDAFSLIVSLIQIDGVGKRLCFCGKAAAYPNRIGGLFH